MILFFDRSVGKRMPEALRVLRRLPLGIEYHQLHFPQDELDDQWLPQVGAWGWTVIGHDWSYHLNGSELAAIKQYGIGCFYMWGAEATDWEKLRCFARAYDHIVQAEATTPRPFIYRVTRTGLVKAIPIP